MVEQTVKELLTDAIRYDESLLAHSVYYALQQGYVKLDDPASKIPKDMDYSVIIKMRDDNWLKMCIVKLFTIPMELNRHALYLARKEDDAIAKHFKIYGKLAQRVFDVSHKMDVSLYCEETGVARSFRELKREAVCFPCYVGEVGR